MNLIIKEYEKEELLAAIDIAISLVLTKALYSQPFNDHQTAVLNLFEVIKDNITRAAPQAFPYKLAVPL